MNILIRKETQKDYQKIAEVNLLAFRKRTPGPDFFREMILGDVLRHTSYYDNDLALVAEIDGDVVGYAHFSPVDVYFSGELVKSIILAPLSVHPDYQGMGVGGMLLREGHKIAKGKGYGCSILFGEKDYYPRFGYIPKAFSASGIKISKNNLPIRDTKITERLVEPRDIKVLTEIWHKQNKKEPLAVFPGNNFMDWVSHEREFKAVTLLREGQIIGYLRYEIDRPWAIMYFMATCKKGAEDILGYYHNKISDKEFDYLSIPVNPSSPNIPCDYIENVNMSIYGMVKILDVDNKNLTEYIEYIQASTSNIAVINLPPAIEWC